MLVDTEQPASTDAGSTTDHTVTSTQVETEQTTGALNSEATEGAELEPELTAAEEAELEYEGRKFKVPKEAADEVKSALMRHADYTRKTQEVAEHRRAVEAER